MHECHNASASGCERYACVRHILSLSVMTTPLPPGLDWSNTCTYTVDKVKGALMQQPAPYPLSCTAALCARRMGDVITAKRFREFVRIFKGWESRLQGVARQWTASMSACVLGVHTSYIVL
jgi:hypothetical protein